MKSQSLLVIRIFLCALFISSEALGVEAAAKTASSATSASSAEGASSSTNTAAQVSDANYTAEAQKFKTTLNNLMTAATAAKTAGATVPSFAEITKANSAVSYYANLHGTCVKTQSAASMVCREETSPTLQTTLNSINTAASAITAVAITDACSTMAKIAALATAGLTAYTSICSAARATCETSCSTVKTNLQTVVSAAITNVCTPQPNLPASSTACTEYQTAFSAYASQLPTIKLDNSEADTKSVAIRSKACTYTYASMIVSAGTGIASLVNSYKQSQSCEEETSAETTTTTTETCDLEENASLPECLCLANPRLTGCANEYSKLSTGEDEVAASIGTTSATASDVSLEGLDTSSTISHGETSSSSGSSGVGAPVGGNSGLSSSGVSASRSAASEAAKASDMTEASGGVESGGASGRGGAMASSASANNYRAYLPGGAKDPQKNMAGQEAWAREVTSEGGKSNFEKVRSRYEDNRTSLLNN